MKTGEFFPREFLQIQVLIQNGVTITEYRMEPGGRIAVDFDVSVGMAAWARVRANERVIEDVRRHATRADMMVAKNRSALRAYAAATSRSLPH